MNLENLPAQEKLTKGFYYLLLPLALLFWIGWGLKFGVWWDIGIYSVLVVLLGFGLIGGFVVYGKAN
ncbi:MAG: hypothetical protein P8R32_02760 [Candidatus Poseidoniia archaeon]|nr:hypothetical protein [Candidatus Poseidoniia archaeon]